MENYSWIISEINQHKISILDNQLVPWNNSKLMDLYTFVYTKCINDKSSDKNEALIMYDIHEKVLTEFLNDCLSRKPENVTIKFFIDAYEKYNFFSTSVNFIFRYLNKFFILKFKSISLNDRTHNLFMSKFFSTMDDHSSEIIYNEACKGHPFSNDFVKDFSKLLSIYKKSELKNQQLLSKYKEGIDYFYNSQIHNFSSVDDLIEYYNLIHSQLVTVCKAIEIPELIQELTSIFLDSIRTESILNSMKIEFSSLIMNNDVNKLCVLYNIHTEFFMECLIIYTEELCSQTFNFFEKILSLHDLIEDLILKLENENISSIFYNTVTKLIKNIENFSKILAIEILKNKKYCFLLQMLENKETFITIYGKTLLNRLLNTDFLDITNEISIIEEMKIYISNSLVYKLESLIIDYKNAILLTRKFQSVSKLKSSIFVFSEKTFLTQPFNLDSSYLSKDLLESSKHIEDFYKTQFNLRKLSFNYWQSSVTIEATFYNPTKKYYMTFYVIQYIILTKIQDAKSKSQLALVQDLQIEPSIISAVLHSLTNHKTPILLKSGLPHKLDTINDIFTVNESFTSSQDHIRFKLPILDQSKKQDSSNIELNVPFILRAKITKLLKHHPLSKDEIFKQIANISQNKKIIDKQIDFLIAQEYIEINDDIFSYIP